MTKAVYIDYVEYYLYQSNSQSISYFRYCAVPVSPAGPQSSHRSIATPSTRKVDETLHETFSNPSCPLYNHENGLIENDGNYDALVMPREEPGECYVHMQPRKM